VWCTQSESRPFESLNKSLMYEKHVRLFQGIVRGAGYLPNCSTLKKSRHNQHRDNFNIVTGRLAVDGWAVTFDTARRGVCGLYQM